MRERDVCVGGDSVCIYTHNPAVHCLVKLALHVYVGEVHVCTSMLQPVKPGAAAIFPRSLCFCWNSEYPYHLNIRLWFKITI